MSDEHITRNPPWIPFEELDRHVRKFDPEKDDPGIPLEDVLKVEHTDQGGSLSDEEETT